MSFYSRRRRQHYEAAQTAIRQYIAPVKAAIAPYATGVAAWATSAAVGSVYSPYAGALVGAGVTLAGGEGAEYWAEQEARGDGASNAEVRAAGEENRYKAYEAGAIGTLIGTWGSVNISQWGVLSAETASFETSLLTIGQNYQTIDAALSGPPQERGFLDPSFDWGPDSWMQYGADISAAEQQSPMLDDEDEDEPKKKRRKKRRYQVSR